jgi:glycosyltransferase involved in cell wall biosynthesis
MKISVVVVSYNMRREAARTLFSLATPYQRRIAGEDYEVIVVDNGSAEPLDRGLIESFGPGFRYFFRETDSASPAGAVNFGVAKARHECIGVFVDGARIVTPGLLFFARQGLAISERAVVGALGWHLGPDYQWLSMTRGYDREAEDELLRRSEWTTDGYRLFSISSLAGSSRYGYFRTPGECNTLFLRRALYEELGGMDEHFTSIGGGLVNCDFFRRACEARETELVMLLGEGSFHQLHGGASTNVTGEERERRMLSYAHEYEALRGKPFESPEKDAIYLGSLPPAGFDVLEYSIRQAAEGNGTEAVSGKRRSE